MSRLNIVIPLAGAGSRFSKNLWQKGKPMIDVAGVPLPCRVIDNVKTDVFVAHFISSHVVTTNLSLNL